MSGYMNSAKTIEWATPAPLFTELDSEFHFDLDSASTDENAKCEKHFTERENGLTQDWFGCVFCNPPYGRVIERWVDKAIAEVDAGNADTVVMLLPSRTDTKWFHRLLTRGAEIRFIKGRLHYGGGGGKHHSQA